jgi:hypothetical protein
VDVSFWALDGSGNTVGSPLTASYGISTSDLAGFSGLVDPVYKNYNSTAGGTGMMDNAYFAILAVPEPASWSLLAIGALALIARRRKA